MQTVYSDMMGHTSAPAELGEAATAQFFIPASVSIQERKPRTLKHGDTFGVFDFNGDIVPGKNSPDGLYHRDTRHLSQFQLTISGARPLLLSSILRDDNSALTCDLTNPDLFDSAGKMAVEHDLIHFRRSRFIWNARCFERLAVRNFAQVSKNIRVTVTFASDFADLFEVRGTCRERRGTYEVAELGTTAVRLSYVGLDGRHRTTDLRFEPAPTTLASDHAVFDLVIGPQERKLFFIEVGFNVTSSPASTAGSFLAALMMARRTARSYLSRAPSVSTSNQIFNEAFRRAVSDLYMLATETAEGPYPYAGIPWFSTVFGRDALITALLMLWFDPQIARGVLRHLAINQATAIDPFADAEPGKILHEIRQGEMAELREVPFRRYYGSIDATPLFVMLAGAYLERTGDIETLQSLWPNITAALKWIESYGDKDDDGFVEYQRQTTEGLINQGWKDSYDLIFHADGVLARGPIALVEVQAYVYGAFRAAAQIARAIGHLSNAVEFDGKAVAFRERFDQAFFSEALGTYVLALDGDKRPCQIRTSNAGHALLTGIAFPARAPYIARSLMARTSFSGWGIRTLNSMEPRYNPMSYHNGSVWPHDNALIANGLARYGFRSEAARIFDGLFAASTYMDLWRLPELFCGFPRQRTCGPTSYPVACAPQAWAAAALLSLVQSCMGLSFDRSASRIAFMKPILPSFLDEIVVRRFALGSASADVAMRRVGAEVAMQVLSRCGTIQVTTTS